jgi:polyadenylate-binding protein
MQLADKIVFVGPFLKRVERGEGREERFTNVYVKNLGDDVDDEGLKKMAAEHGPVTSAVVMTVGAAARGLRWPGRCMWGAGRR